MGTQVRGNDRKEYLEFIKNKYPIGSFIYDNTRSEPYKVSKRSIFEIYEFEYNEESQPINDGDVWIEFYIRNTGKHSENYYIKCCPKNWILKRYQK